MEAVSDWLRGVDNAAPGRTMPYTRCPSCRTKAYISPHEGDCPHCGQRLDAILKPGSEPSGHGIQGASQRGELRKVDDAAPQEPSEP